MSLKRPLRATSDTLVTAEVLIINQLSYDIIISQPTACFN